MYRPPLHVHVLTLAGDDPAALAADDLVGWLAGDPAHSRAHADVPTFRWTGTAAGLPAIPASEADCSVLLLVTGQRSVADAGWRRRANEVAARFLASEQPVVHVALDKHFANFGAPLATLQTVRAFESHTPEHTRLQVLYAITFQLRAKHGTPKPKLFLSHAKRDGLQAALETKRLLDGMPAAEAFFDAVDIAPSDHFEATLGDVLQHAAIVVFLTDVYASRYWCRWEALVAKRHLRPMLVVDLLALGEPASAPYLGNGPTLRLGDGPRLAELAKLQEEDEALAAERSQDAPRQAQNTKRRAEIAAAMAQYREAFVPSAARVVAAALLEVLRAEHDAARTEAVRASLADGAGMTMLGRSPELVTLPSPTGQAIRLLHADPPLPKFELELMAKHRPDVAIASVTDALAGRLSNTQPLRGKTIAL
ncbi:MAG: hypothetical protein ABIP94_06000, partial [Planctomycetota bacterium]